MISQMDQWMENYARVAKEKFNKADPEYPGAGAAGGMGFAFMSFTDAVLESGIKIVLDEIGLDKDVQNADVVITGEGRLDRQTSMGKARWEWLSWQNSTTSPLLRFRDALQKRPLSVMKRESTPFSRY